MKEGDNSSLHSELYFIATSYAQPIVPTRANAQPHVAGLAAVACVAERAMPGFADRRRRNTAMHGFILNQLWGHRADNENAIQPARSNADSHSSRALLYDHARSKESTATKAMLIPCATLGFPIQVYSRS